MTEEECAFHDFDEPAIMKGAAISLTDSMNGMTHIAGAQSMRALKENLVPNPDNKAGPPLASVFPRANFGFMGDTLRTKSLPMPIRTYDLGTLYIIDRIEHRFNTPFQQRTKNWLLDDSNHAEFKELLTSIIMFHSMGRVHAFYAFTKCMKKQHPEECNEVFLPSASTVEYACKYLILTSRKKTQRVTDWMSDQFGSALPDQWKTTQGAVSLWRKVAQDADYLVSQIIDFVNGNKTDSREEVVKHLCSYLCSTFYSNDNWGKEKSPFVAHTIIVDLEEVSNEMFGEIKTAHLWHGSNEALKALKNGIRKSNISANAMKPATEAVLGMIKDKYCNEMSEEALAIHGLYKDNENILQIEQNGRKFSITDCEAVLCKIMILKVHTHPNRVVNAAKLDCTYNQPIAYDSHKWSEKSLDCLQKMAVYYKSNSFPCMPVMF
jgi:hypothetical protein